MKYLNVFLTLASGFAFISYGLYYFFSPTFKMEFERFGLKKFGTLAATLQIFGGVGLLAGLLIPYILMISALGLAVLMLLGVITRIKVKDSFSKTMPALFFMCVNTYLFVTALQGLE